MRSFFQGFISSLRYRRAGFCLTAVLLVCMGYASHATAGDLYRLRVGVVPTEEDAADLLKELSTSTGLTLDTVHYLGQYHLVTGAYETEQEALEAARGSGLSGFMQLGLMVVNADIESGTKAEVVSFEPLGETSEKSEVEYQLPWPFEPYERIPIEISPSGASAMNLSVSPVLSGAINKPIFVQAKAEGVEEVTLYYRLRGSVSYIAAPLQEVEQGIWAGEIPAWAVTPAGVEYYIQGRKGARRVFADATREHPFRVQVD